MENLDKQVIAGLRRMAEMIDPRGYKSKELIEAIEWIRGLPWGEGATNILEFPARVQLSLEEGREHRRKTVALLKAVMERSDVLLIDHLYEALTSYGKSEHLIRGKLFLRFYNESEKKDAITLGPYTTVRLVYNAIRVGERRELVAHYNVTPCAWKVRGQTTEYKSAILLTEK